MVKTQADILIERAPPRVFKFVADDFFLNYPRWSPEVQFLEALTAGPIQVGWRGRQIRLDHGRRTDSEFRVTVFEPERRLSFEGTTSGYRIDYQFEPCAVRTRICFTFELLEIGMAMQPFRNMIRNKVQQTTDRMAANLKCLIECELSPGAD